MRNITQPASAEFQGWLQAFHPLAAVSLPVLKELWVNVFCYVHTLISYYDAYHNPASERRVQGQLHTQ